VPQYFIDTIKMFSRGSLLLNIDTSLSSFLNNELYAVLIHRCIDTLSFYKLQFVLFFFHLKYFKIRTPKEYWYR